MEYLGNIILTVLRIVFILGNIIGLGFALWQLYAMLPLFKKYQPKAKQGELAEKDLEYKKIAVLIPAHDEEKVIANLVHSVLRQNYPRDSFQVFVIADNCQDNTAAVARAAGAEVYERQDPNKRTKSYALNWFFNIFLDKYGEQYQAVTILDADNVINSDYLYYMNRRLNKGERVIVGYRKGKNPSASVWSSCNSLFWVMQKRAFDHSRYVVDRSLLSVGGTGFIFDLDLIRDSGWNTKTLTEDIEFAMDMNLHGVKITYCREAEIYDEQPEDFITTMKQRWRWMYGSLEVMQQKSIPLLKSVFKGHWENFDSFSIASLFGVFVLSVFNFILGLLLLWIDTGSFMPVLISIATSAIGAEVIMSLFIYLLTALEKQHWSKQWLGIVFFPIFIFLTTLTVFAAMFKKPGWQKIEHSDQSSITDLE